MARPVVLVNSKASLADLIAVARGEAEVVVDTAPVEPVEKRRDATGGAGAADPSTTVEPLDAGDAADGGDAPTSPFLTWQEARAVAFATACGAMRVSSCMPKPQLPEFLARALNAGLAPQLPRDDTTLALDASEAALDAFVNGDGAAFRKDEDPAAAEPTGSICARLGVALLEPKLNSAQRSALRGGCNVMAGLNGLEAYGPARLAGTADSMTVVLTSKLSAPPEVVFPDRDEVAEPASPEGGEIESATV